MAAWIRWSCAILILAAVSPRADQQAEAACQGLKGTFLQLTDAQLARPPAEWRPLFDELRIIGINTLFVQWTVLDRKPLFRTAQHETAADQPLASILDPARTSAIRGWFGVALASSDWEDGQRNRGLTRPSVCR